MAIYRVQHLISAKSLTSATKGKFKISSTLEPAFLYSGFSGLWRNTSGWSDKASRYFAFEVKRNPEDLKKHVQRILHHISRKDSEQLYGAMIDLIIVLKGNGTALKRRLLENAKYSLQPWQTENLHKAMHCRSLSMAKLTSIHAILDNSVNNVQPLITPLSSKDNINTLSSEGSFQSLKQTPTDEQFKLEIAIIDGSKDYLLHKELTDFYMETGDHDAFIATFSKIEIQEQPLLDLWWAAHDHLKRNNEQ